MEIVDAKTVEQVYNWITDDNDLEIDGLTTGDYIWRDRLQRRLCFSKTYQVHCQRWRYSKILK